LCGVCVFKKLIIDHVFGHQFHFCISKVTAQAASGAT
jgi:hypothetical protein